MGNDSKTKIVISIDVELTNDEILGMNYTQTKDLCVLRSVI